MHSFLGGLLTPLRLTRGALGHELGPGLGRGRRGVSPFGRLWNRIGASRDNPLARDLVRVRHGALARRARDPTRHARDALPAFRAPPPERRSGRVGPALAVLGVSPALGRPAGRLRPRAAAHPTVRGTAPLGVDVRAVARARTVRGRPHKPAASAARASHILPGRLLPLVARVPIAATRSSERSQGRVSLRCVPAEQSRSDFCLPCFRAPSTGSTSLLHASGG